MLKDRKHSMTPDYITDHVPNASEDVLCINKKVYYYLQVALLPHSSSVPGSIQSLDYWLYRVS